MSETTGATVETTAATTPTAEELNAELARVRDALKAANKEAADRRRKLDELEQADAKRKEEATQALQTANDRLIRAAFVAEASQHGALHPADAYALADRSNVTVDDSGNVSGVTEAVKALLDSNRLSLRARTVPNLDAGSGGNQGQRLPTLTEAELAVARRMGIKPEDYAAQKRST